MEVAALGSPVGGGAWYLCPLDAPRAPREAQPSLHGPNTSRPPTRSPRPTPARGPPGSLSVLLCPAASRALGCLGGARPVAGRGWWFPGRRARPQAWGPSRSNPWGWPHQLSGLLPVHLLPPRPVALLTPPREHRPQGEVVTGPPGNSAITPSGHAAMLGAHTPPAPTARGHLCPMQLLPRRARGGGPGPHPLGTHTHSSILPPFL